MNVTPTQSTYKGTSDQSTRAQPGKQEFLQLLTAELRNQDPMQPTDDKEFIAQLAQFNVLEQLQQLNTTMDSMAGLSTLTQGATLLGKWADLSSESSAGIAGGYISGVSFKNNSLVVTVDGHEVGLSDIVGIKENGDGAAS